MRPTRPDPQPGFSDEEIAEQVAAFQKRGGKVEQVTNGAQVAPAASAKFTIVNGKQKQAWKEGRQ